ncbi:hypothetical protein [Pseudoclavibacter sp. CFCC 13611]|uniref:hypothetical protein n=1 Tax=Pseudoclavibacter sp. CFCC 13611 TaxID=2615178 RepID=UPI001300CD38|nr:hypothetical protein [Pseudoclavibacter sp. CFCC 13611]KAB1662928.1 hypothetical protein F8O08_10265 [Pseudoclavibacter sp. CFCC 13611]
MSDFEPRDFTFSEGTYPLHLKIDTITAYTGDELIRIHVDQNYIHLHPDQLGPVLLALIDAGTSITDDKTVQRPSAQCAEPQLDGIGGGL